ncbi:MAG TPA: SHOCT domain-containing protein [Gaiellaceae bacterium]|nr:SHOCT domain-containing protein [Gaiellaceae bacterium]
MLLAADYPFLDVFWTMLVFFLWVAWFWLLFAVWTDLFRRTDVSGWGKALWLVFTILLPFLGVFVYLIVEHDGMTQRTVERASAQRAELDDYVRQTAGTGGAAAEIEKAKQLLESGAISQSEYEALKQKALA